MDGPPLFRRGNIMINWFNHAAGVLGTVGRSIGHVRGAVVVAAGLGLFSFLTAAPTTAAGDDRPAAEAAEDSVLIATRESATSQTPSAISSIADSTAIAEDGENLEPISEIAERTPELATSTSETATGATDDASEFGAALAKVAQTEESKSSPAKRAISRVVSRESIPYEPATFHGIEVGKSTESALLQAWGKPAESIATEDGAVLTYDMEPFQGVEVLVSGDAVSAIKIALAANLEPEQLAKQLSLDEIEPVTVTDEEGQPLGLAFPERGVLFMFASPEEQAAASSEGAAPTVSHVAIQPLDARAFALRAENHLHGPYQQNVRDLKTALALEPELAHAQWLLAEIYLATGQADLAESASSAACELEPKNCTFQLCHARAATLLGQYDDAVHEIRTVLDRDDLQPLVRAQALHEMARLASLGDVQIAAKSIPFDTKAIEIADKLATSKNAKERRAAKQLLVDAHLAIAEEVARQAFNNKVDSLSLWIGRASGLAEDYITNDGGSVELRLKVAQVRSPRWRASSRRSARPRGSLRPKKRARRCLPSRTTSCGSNTSNGNWASLISTRCGSNTCGSRPIARSTTGKRRSRTWPRGPRRGRRSTRRSSWSANCTSTWAPCTPSTSRTTRRRPNGTTKRPRS